MTFRRAASAGILGSAVAVLAVLTMGGDRPPQFGDPLPGLTPRPPGPLPGRQGRLRP